VLPLLMFLLLLLLLLVVLLLLFLLLLFLMVVVVFLLLLLLFLLLLLLLLYFAVIITAIFSSYYYRYCFDDGDCGIINTAITIIKTSFNGGNGNSDDHDGSLLLSFLCAWTASSESVGFVKAPLGEHVVDVGLSPGHGLDVARERHGPVVGGLHESDGEFPLEPGGLAVLGAKRQNALLRLNV